METTLTINTSGLSDDALVAELQRLTRNRRELTAELLAHIAEMDARQLYREHACSSMFRYATERLGMSEAAAYKHIQVGRAARLFPYIFELLEAGATYLSHLVVLVPHLTADNHQDLLSAASRQSKRDVERLVAERFPKPSVPDRIRKLPAPRAQTMRRSSDGTPAAGDAPTLPAAMPTQPTASGAAETTASPSPALELRAPKPGKVEPLAKSSFKVEFTADEALYADIQKAKELLGPSLRRGELNELFGLALRRLVEDLEKKKYAKTSRPRPARCKSTKPAAKKSRYVPNHVKRAVVERDEGCCAYVDAEGNRCGEPAFSPKAEYVFMGAKRPFVPGLGRRPRALGTRVSP